MESPNNYNIKSSFIKRRFASNVETSFDSFNVYQDESPLKNIEINKNQSQTNHQQQNQPLNDISNRLEFNQDAAKDLENLIFGKDSEFNCESIKESLEVEANCTNLIGDRTKEHVLPLIPSSKHHDLQCISANTLVDLLNRKYESQIDEFIIIDSRYPYEFDGGHIQNALNLYTKDKLIEEMFIKRLSLKKPKRTIVIFHCEFSSERGPSLLRFLRNQDRKLNSLNYPNLFYPELYLLEGGYKSFYETFKAFCEPQTYKPMLHAEHLNDLKHFRAKAKSWETGKHLIIHKLNTHLNLK